MAIMDMPEIEPMATWLPRMLKPHGRFVFSVVHPAFNSGHATLVATHYHPVIREFYERLLASGEVKKVGRPTPIAP